MSYSVIIDISDTGIPVITQYSGQMPDGKLVVNGHEDPTYRTVGVTRTDATGHNLFGGSAQEYKPFEPPAPPTVVAAAEPAPGEHGDGPAADPTGARPDPAEPAPTEGPEGPAV